MAMKTIAAALAAAVLLSVVPAAADETGLDVIHAERREGKRLCFTDHFHYGNGNSSVSRNAAIGDAVASWQSFTALEYGSSWGDWRKAGSKKIACGKNGAQWSCQIEGRPCK